MLSREAAKRAMSLISNISDPVSTIHSQFVSEFSFEERYSILSSLSILLCEALLDHQQQISAALLIYSSFDESPLSENPFVSTFLYINQIYLSNPNMFCPTLIDLIPIILSDTPLDFLRTLTIPQILQSAFSAPNTTQKGNLPKNKKNNAFLSRLLVEKNNDPSCERDNDQILIELLSSDALITPFEPTFPRPIPDLMPISKDEVQFIKSDFQPYFVYDQNVALNSKEEGVILLNKAAEEKLSPNEVESVLNAFNNFPVIVESNMLDNAKLKELISLNPNIAKEYISKALQKRKELIQFVLDLDINIASVELVKHLIMNHFVDDNFVQNYATNSIESISKINDPQQKNMAVMFFCRFMIFLKENNIQFTKEVIVELTNFCFEFAQKGIPVVNNLFTLLERKY